MLSAQAAINRFRRDMTLGRALRLLLLAAGMAAGATLPFMADRALIALAVILGLWVILSVRSAKNSWILAPSQSLIATGQFEEAERRIDQAMSTFSISRTSKLLGLHHLAVLRHKQRRWSDAVTLGQAVLTQPLSTMPGLERSTRLLLADALLETGDARGAGDAIAPLRFQQLGLVESMSMMQVDLDVLSRQGGWDAMTAGLPGKVQLAELFPPAAAARTQALLALAAQKRGLSEWSDWLRKRVELLTDVGTLTTERPLLWELWQNDSVAATPASPLAGDVTGT